MIVRYIQDENLKKQDKLPSVDFFRRQFGCGTTTVSAAINELRDEGVLVVRDKIGAFVRDQNVAGHAGRVIGISVFSMHAGAMINMLIVELLLELSQQGCIAKLFFRQGNLQEGHYEFSCDDFPGLARSVEEASIDALIHFGKFDAKSMRFFSEHGIPEVFMGFLADDNSNCCVCDLGKVLENMFQHEGVRSAKRPCIFIPPSVAGKLSAIFAANGGSKQLQFVTPRERDDRFTFEIASQLAAMPTSKRPDMLLFFDDFIASAVLMNLSLLIPLDDMPGVALLINTELPVAYPPLKQFYTWVLDIHEFAKLTAEKLTTTLRAENTDTGSIFYEPNFRDLSMQQQKNPCKNRRSNRKQNLTNTRAKKER